MTTHIAQMFVCTAKLHSFKCCLKKKYWVVHFKVQDTNFFIEIDISILSWNIINYQLVSKTALIFLFFQNRTKLNSIFYIFLIKAQSCGNIKSFHFSGQKIDKFITKNCLNTKEICQKCNLSEDESKWF